MENSAELRERLERIEQSHRRKRNFSIVFSFGILAAFAGLYLAYDAMIDSKELAMRASSEREAAMQRIDVARAELESLQAENGAIEAALIETREELEAARSQLAALPGYQELRQQTIYVGDRVSFAADGTLVAPDEVPGSAIGFQCAQLGGPTDLREELTAQAPDGYRLVRLDLVAARAGGMCGHSYYSATFAPAAI